MYAQSILQVGLGNHFPTRLLLLFTSHLTGHTKSHLQSTFSSSRLLLGAFLGNTTASNFQASWPGIGCRKHKRATSRTEETAVRVGRSYVHICPIWKPKGWSFLLSKLGTDAPDNSLGLKTEWEWASCNAENWTGDWFNKRQMLRTTPMLSLDGCQALIWGVFSVQRERVLMSGWL